MPIEVVLFVVMLIVVMPSVDILTVVMPNVVMLILIMLTVVMLTLVMLRVLICPIPTAFFENQQVNLRYASDEGTMLDLYFKTVEGAVFAGKLNQH